MMATFAPRRSSEPFTAVMPVEGSLACAATWKTDALMQVLASRAVPSALLPNGNHLRLALVALVTRRSLWRRMLDNTA